MAESLLAKLVRNFPENGSKLLLENPANLHDLLALVQEPHVAAIDFAAMTVERTHFVQASYAHVSYHARSADEQAELRDVVDRAVLTDPHRKEFTKMGQTIAEMYKQQGELAMARTMLLRQLRKRFKRLPRQLESRVRAATNLRDLETWLVNFANATTLAEVGIPTDN